MIKRGAKKFDSIIICWGLLFALSTISSVFIWFEKGRKGGAGLPVWLVKPVNLWLYRYV